MTGGGAEFPYRRVVDDLRAAIVTGRLAPGAKLGTEWELAERFATSRPTVRRAIAVLKGEGLVVAEQGRGTFVRPEPPVRLTITAANYRRHRAEGRPGFDAQVAEQGRTARQQLIEVAEQPADADVASWLGLPTGAPVIVRRRLLLADDEPVARCVSWYPADLTRHTIIARPVLIRGGVHRVIEDPDGPIRRVIARSTGDVTARMPHPDEVEQLRLRPGNPVVRVLRIVEDSDGQVVDAQETVAAADRHRLRYEVDLRWP